MFRVSRALYFLPLATALTLGQSCSYFAPKHDGDGKKPSGQSLKQYKGEQPPPPADSKASSGKAATPAAAPVAAAPLSVNEMPMYNGTVKPFKERNIPYNIAQSQQMSRDALKVAWTLLIQYKDTKQSMARFNQAWVCDPDNFEVYWGFGMVISARAFARGEDTAARLNEATHLLEKAAMMAPKDTRVQLDLANVYNKLGYYYQAIDPESREAATALSRGEGYARRVCMTEPKNGRAHFVYAGNLYYQKKYQEAWIQVKQAQDLQYQVPVKFIADLNSKMGEQQ